LTSLSDLLYLPAYAEGGRDQDVSFSSSVLGDADVVIAQREGEFETQKLGSAMSAAVLGMLL
jgi:hypothetical protein